MNKDIIKQIKGFDIHLMMQDDSEKTISYFDFIEPHDTVMSINNISNEDVKAPFSMNRYWFNFVMKCNGFTVNYNKIEKKNYNMIPKIMDVNIIVPDKVVEVTFADGTKEKSVCLPPDKFSLETAISICISKKIMGGSGAYNNAIKCGMKTYQDKLKKEAAEQEEQERIAKKRAKKLAYKERRIIKRTEEEVKRREQEKEEQIEIQKEAYLRAMDVLKAEGRGV